MAIFRIGPQPCRSSMTNQKRGLNRGAGLSAQKQCQASYSYKSVITSQLEIDCFGSFNKDGGKQRKGYRSNENVERKQRISGLFLNTNKASVGHHASCTANNRGKGCTIQCMLTVTQDFYSLSWSLYLLLYLFL